MKKLLQTLFFFLLVTQICFAQWYQQNSGTSYTLLSVYFVDSNNGWAVGGSELLFSDVEVLRNVQSNRYKQQYDHRVILRTTNSGIDWITQIDEDGFPPHSVCFTDSNNGWVVSTLGTILRTTNGGTTWSEQISGIMNFLQDVSFSDSNNGIVVGGGGIILRTSNGGTIWTEQSSGTTNHLEGVSFIDTNNGIAVGRSGTILRTTNGGTTWIEQSSGTTFDLFDIYFTDENNGTAVGGDTFYGQNAVILITTNGGTTWIEQISGTTDLLWDVSFTDLNNGWIVGSNGTILRTTNAGTIWTSQSSGTNEWLTGVSFTDTDNGWAVGDSGIILHTTNGGGIVPVELTTFTAQADNQKVILKWTTATELNNNGFEIQRRVAESEFATIGFVKGEGTTTNQKEYSYIDKDLVDAKYFYRLKQVDFNGSYEYSNVIEVDVRILNEYALEQNYPNPFNPVTTIGYVLKEKTSAKLILLNAIGEEVAVLVNEEQDKGFHKVDFNASSLTSGVYFYQLKASSFIETKKMLLLK